MKRILLLIVCAIALSTQVMNAQEEVVTNDLIIQLLDEGFSDEEIIGFIESSSTRELKMDLKNMRALKQHGASTTLIQYIQQIAKADYGYDGVYWWNVPENEKPKKLYRTNFNREEKKAGIGAFAATVGGALIGDALGGGASIARGAALGAALGGGNVKSESLALMGAHAAVVLTAEQATSPVFRFYFPKTEMDSFNGNQADAWYYGWMNSIQSPNEFECVKLSEKKKKRTLPSGLSFSVAGFGSTSSGKQNVVDFEIKAAVSKILCK